MTYMKMILIDCDYKFDVKNRSTSINDLKQLMSNRIPWRAYLAKKLKFEHDEYINNQKILKEIRDKKNPEQVLV